MATVMVLFGIALLLLGRMFWLLGSSTPQGRTFSMLVLTRTAFDEKNEIEIVTSNGEVILLTVCEVRADKVRLGFTAPRTVAIRRKELSDSCSQTATPKEFHHAGRAT